MSSTESDPEGYAQYLADCPLDLTDGAVGGTIGGNLRRANINNNLNIKREFTTNIKRRTFEEGLSGSFEEAISDTGVLDSLSSCDVKSDDDFHRQMQRLEGRDEP